jgi:hypothetical protein
MYWRMKPQKTRSSVPRPSNRTLISPVDTLFCLGESFFLTRRQADFTGFVPMSVLGSLADMSGCVKKASALPLKADILRGG